jgi:Bacteriophage head to tail connecting protein
MTKGSAGEDCVESRMDKRDFARLFTRWGQLKSERATWVSHWKEISDYLLPRSGRFFVQDRNKGWKRNLNILDSTGTRALRVLGAGLMAGSTSPARPWFRLSTPFPDLNKSMAVRLWLSKVQEMMLAIFQKSNTYRTLHQMYEELGAFGTAASIIAPDFNTVIRHHPLTVGEFCLATDWSGDVTTIYREFQKTVHELVGEFGYDKCSLSVRNMYDRGTYDSWVTVIHAIEPRDEREVGKPGGKNKKYRSVYFEVGGENFLRESGFDEFPALCPRWATAGGDIYGNSPGMDALGDIRQLQHEQLWKARVINHQIDPPLLIPTMLKNRDIDTLPGGRTYSDGQIAIKTLYDVKLDLPGLLQDIRDTQQRIEECFYKPLFMLVSGQNDHTMTATEVAERQEEKLVMLGPVIERKQNEIDHPLIDSAFHLMMKAGLIPLPPPEMHGIELNVEFISMLAQAQKAIGTNSIDKFVMTLGTVARMAPGVLDKFDSDEWVDIYSDLLDVPPDLIVADKQVALVRAQRQKAQQQQQQVANLQAASQATKNLAQSPTNQPSALTNVMSSLQGYNSGANQP